MKGTVAPGVTVARNNLPSYSRRLTDALDRAGVSVRGLARLLAEREGGSIETKRRNVYKWIDGGVEPEPLRAGLLAILLNAPELAVVSPRRPAGHRLEELAALAVANEGSLRELRAAAEEHGSLLEGTVRALEDLSAGLEARLDQLESRVRALEQ